MPFPFIKMHGLGNDFVIMDARKNAVSLNADIIRRIADRHRGVGCDQLIVLEEPKNKNADLFMAIYNSDGSRAGMCGNAARCIGAVELNKKAGALRIETDSATLTATAANDLIAVDMGPALLGWQDIPLAHAANTLGLDTGKTGLPLAVAVSMGNPHCVFFMQHVEGIDLAGIGPQIERHPLFPERTNVEFAEVINRMQIRMRVWERGAGVTQACGSGACAVLVAAVQRDLTERKAEIILDGGSLFVEWLENGHVVLSGPAAFSFSGEIADSLMAA